MACAVALGAAGVLPACGSDDDQQQERASAPANEGLRSYVEVRSRPDLRPPSIAVERAPEQTDARLVFASPRMEKRERDAATHQQGAIAFDQRGRIRWFRPAPDGEPTTDVRVQRYRGEPVLTWWQGAASKYGIGRGHCVIADQSYEVIATVQAGNKFTSDLHECLLTPRDTMLLTIYSRARRDLRSMGGLRDAQVTQGIIQEVDVESGEVLFEWQSLDDIEPSESYRKPERDPQQSFDYFHINSVGEDENGDFIVSARHTSGVYKIDRETGELVWRLGGKESDFEMGRGAEFGFQHDARVLDDGTLQIFDNVVEAEDGQDQTASSVKRLRLDEERGTATVVQRFRQPDREWAESQGNSQPLEDGGVMVGWGSLGTFSRFDAGGRLLFDAHLPVEYDSYRAYLAEWEGRPAVPPAINARRDEDQVSVWASWNGSTEVAAWQMLAGETPESLEPIGAPAEWTGLETRIVRVTDAPYVAIEALDADGEPLERSAPARP